MLNRRFTTMDRWKAGGVTAVLVLALAMAGCQDGGETNEDLMSPGTMPVMTDGGGDDTSEEGAR
ncbi:MAG: hypothetical protein KY392_02140 [Chloroflexi bacterium]|nr:hypothetical protein [Chloroflexota bacterium]